MNTSRAFRVFWLAVAITMMDWGTLIEENRVSESGIPRALTYRRTWDSACRPVHVTCDDGNDYVVKGSQVGRSAFNDQVVGRIATHLGAPVGAVGLVQVEAELIAINPAMAHVAPGLAHGSRFVPDCTECQWFRYVDARENRPRFALLALLYGWMIGAEKQFFYAASPPHEVYSFDHDAFFPGGPSWSVESLQAAPYPTEDDVIVTQCGLTHQELQEAAAHLARMTPEIVAAAIAAVPPNWEPVGVEERVALADYLWTRCQDMRS